MPHLSIFQKPISEACDLVRSSEFHVTAKEPVEEVSTPPAGEYLIPDQKREQTTLSTSAEHGSSQGAPDSRLLERILQKDLNAFEELYDRYAPLVYSLTLRLLRQESTAEEVVQDIFLQVWRNAESYDRSRGPFAPWLLTLSRNKAFDYLRSKSERQRRRENHVDELLSSPVMPSFETALDKKRQLEHVRAAMETLHSEQRRAIELAYFEELTHCEIAAKLQKPLGTVKSWIRGGMLHLKQGLQATPSATAGPSACCPAQKWRQVPKSILIVDDHEEIRTLLRAVLEGECEVKVCGEATDGYDAMDKAQQLKPDLIVLDLSMPRMNGIEAARRLKKMLPQSPIVLFTSYHAALQRFDAREAGIDAVVAKNSGMSLLIDSVHSLLQ